MLLSILPDANALGLFVAASVMLLVLPGPAVLYIVTRSVDQGRTAGFVSALGIACGTLVLVLAAAFGLAAIVLSSALAFEAVKYAGAAYLVYLGMRRIMAPEVAAGESRKPPRSLRRVFADGLIVNMLNPKTALFLFAFLPQFVDPHRGHLTAQFLLLGMLFIALGIASDSGYALLSGSLHGALRRHAGLLRGQRYMAGGLLIGLGVVAAFTRAGRN